MGNQVKNMKIVTLTLSPAVDIEYRAKDSAAAGLNRTYAHSLSAGGKGINVSRSVLKCAAAAPDGEQFPFELKTVAPVGGETGELLRRILEKEGLSLTAVGIEENTRVNVSLIPDEGGSLKEVISCISDGEVASRETIDLCLFLREHTLCTFGELVQLFGERCSLLL